MRARSFPGRVRVPAILAAALLVSCGRSTEPPSSAAEAILARDGTPPTWPPRAVLTVVLDLGTSVVLAWTPARDDQRVVGYRIFANGHLAASAGVVPLAIVRGLSAQGDYRFQVEAVDASGHQSTGGPIAYRDRHAPLVSVSGVFDGEVSSAPALIPTFTATDDLLSSVTATLDGAPFVSGTAVSGEGSHLLVVTAVDAVGHATAVSTHFTLDRTPPAVLIVQPVDGMVFAAPFVDLRAQVNEAGTLVAVVANGTPMVRQADGSWAARLALGEGPSTIVVTASDQAGNSGSARVSVVVDTMPPLLAVARPLSGAKIAAASTAVSGTVQDADPVTVNVAGAPATVAPDGTFSSTVALTAGANLITVQALDAAGNASRVNVPVRSNVVPPSIRILSPVDGSLTAGSSVLVRLTAQPADPIDLVSVTVEGLPAPRQADGTFALSVPLSPGVSVIHAQALDGYGLLSTAQVQVISDTTPPSISIGGVFDGQYSNAAALQPTFSAADEHITSVTARLDGAPFDSGTPVTSEGGHDLVVIAMDAVGNASEQMVHFTLDRIPPLIEVSGASDGEVRASPVSLTASASDASLDVVLLVLDGAVVGSPVTVSSEGPHLFAVIARDRAGNEARLELHFRIDLTPPQLVVVSPREGAFLAARPTTVIADVLDDSGIVSVSANGVALSSIGGHYIGQVDLGEGANSINVVATDLAGLRSGQSIGVTLDSIPPQLEVTAPAEGARVGSLLATVTGSVVDATSTAVTVQGVLVTVVGGAFSTSVGLVPGSNAIAVTATDAAGNRTSVLRSVRANASPPALTVLEPADGLVTTAEAIAVSGTAGPGDLTDGVTVTVNGAPALLTGGAFSVTVPLSLGPNVVQVTAQDGYGLSSSVALTVQRDPLPMLLSHAP